MCIKDSVMNIKNEVVKLLENDGGDYYGYSVAISGDGNTAIVGVPYGDNEKDINAGSAYIYTRSDGVWSEQSNLVASDDATGDWFGWSVSISSDGNTAIVGARSDDNNRGSAYIYTHTNGTWTKQSKIVASDRISGDYFGHSVSMSSDGNTAIVGAYGDGNERGINAGSAYVYTRSGNAWSEQAKLVASDGAINDWFGYSVAISGDGNTAIIGAYLDDNEKGTDAGSAYIYTRSDGVWVEQCKLVASDGAASDYFGLSLSISSDGSIAIVGAYRDSERGVDVGGAYIYTRTNGTWSEQSKLLASDGAALDWFGRSVSMSSDGNTAIVGAHFGGIRGSAYVYTRSGDKWNEHSKLLASDGDDHDWFGVSVSISSDGNIAIIGANGDDNERGSAYIFDLT